MNMKEGRGYQQTLRAQKAQDNEARILTEAERLFATERFDRVTLDAVAKAAGVTIPTIQRRFGNKEGLLAACADAMRPRILAQRVVPAGGDLAVAMRHLVDHYEKEGRMVWHFLRQADDVPLLHDGLAEGRRVHRAWVEAVFGAGDPARTDALVAVTDLFVWKLLRVDLGRRRAEVEDRMIAMARAVAGRK